MEDSRENCIIGDIHGCFDEFIGLLSVIKFDPTKIRLTIAGDLGDRGPESYKCVKYIRDLCEKGDARCVLGNHENKHVRHRNHEIRKRLTGKENPMKPMSLNDREFHRQLSDADISWMRKLPLKLHLRDNWWVLHGGLEPALPFEEQSPDQIIRCRYVSNGQYVSSSGKIVPAGRAVPLNKDKSQPANSIYWTDGWNGPQSIVYGHCVHSLNKPLVDERPNGVKCVGIDTGCVYGGHLTAFFLERNEFVKVKAVREYHQLRAQFDE